MRKWIYEVLICILILTGCSANIRTNEEQVILKSEKSEDVDTERNHIVPEAMAETVLENTISEPEVIGADWSEYFDGLNGAAVVYDPFNKKYVIYNQELALTRNSPCSTFKIVSSLIALEHGIIQPDNSAYIVNKPL